MFVGVHRGVLGVAPGDAACAHLLLVQDRIKVPGSVQGVCAMAGVCVPMTLWPHHMLRGCGFCVATNTLRVPFSLYIKVAFKGL
jgi:hypothetical protein